MALWTDALDKGWGVHLYAHQMAGQWNAPQYSNRINWLEVKVVQFALIVFTSYQGDESSH